MSAPHRGVPPLSAMMPSPPPPQSSTLGPFPQQWQGSEESKIAWFQTKMEEEKRRQEEERTRQESHRTETRRVELEMLREAFSHGVPPPLVPLMFVGPGAIHTSGEWLQEYATRNLSVMFQGQQPPGQRQIQPAPGSPSQGGPSLRRETRSIQQIGQVASSSAPPQAVPVSASQPPPGYMSTYQLPGSGILGGVQHPPRQSSLSAPQPPRTNLPRINTANELHIQQVQPPQNMVQMAPPGMPISHSQSHAPQQPESAPVSQSPSIFFHHWVPPGQQSASSSGGGNQRDGERGGGTSGGSPQRQLDSPFSHHPPSNQVSSEYSNSPKKRKSTAAQGQQPPPPTSQPFSPQQSISSPATATPSRTRRHVRHKSIETTQRGFDYTRPVTRQRRETVGGGEPQGSSLNPSHQQQQQSQPPYQPPPPPPPPPPQDDQRHQQQSREHSAPPSHSNPPSRPYSAGSDYRRMPYPPPPPPPNQNPPPPPSSDRDNNNAPASSSDENNRK